MAKLGVEEIRNVCLISHGGAGKTSLAEGMLYSAGITDRLGKTDEGTSVMDYEPEEVRRHISISTSVASIPWKGDKINLIDTPGYFDFVGEVKAGLRVADSAVIVVDAVAGVEVGTELVWRYASERGLPKLIVVNKLDRENADFFRVVEELRKVFGNSIVPLQLPIGKEASFSGLVDLMDAKGDPLPELADSVAEYTDKLVEVAAEGDDALLEKYLEGEQLSPEEMRHGLRRSVMTGRFVPVVGASALKNIGTAQLLDVISMLLPSPGDMGAIEGVNPKTGDKDLRRPSGDEPFSALVFKTMADPYVGRLTLFRVYSGSLTSDSHTYNANKGRVERVGQLFSIRGKHQDSINVVSAGDIAAVAKLQETSTGDTLCAEQNPIELEAIEFPRPVFSVAVVPKSKGDEEKIGSGLARLTEEDPTFKVEKNTETGQTIISGMGDLHLEVITEKLKRKFGVDVNLEPPKIPYRETIRSKVQVEGKHKKQTGGRGQYGHVWLELEPLEPGTEFEFVDKIFGGAVPKQYIPAVEKGVREAMQEGVLAGYPVTDVKVTLYDGSYHTVDSSELAFKIASSMAFKKGALQANPVLLEPIVSVEVTVPDQFMGDVIGDLNKKRGRVIGMEPREGNQVIKALVPQAEMSKYAIDLRSLTQGRGTFTVAFSHYEEVPANIAQEIMEKSRKE